MSLNHLATLVYTNLIQINSITYPLQSNTGDNESLATLISFAVALRILTELTIQPLQLVVLLQIVNRWVGVFIPNKEITSYNHCCREFADMVERGN